MFIKINKRFYMAAGLIVDDSKFMRRIIADILVSGGHTIIGEADNGQDGVDLYSELKPDFVTMDITMGGKDGINAVKEIKTKFPGSKIIVVSALNENTIKMNDEEINADAYITKPFDSETLLKLVEKII
jgi:two-component system chemotaxis response regulator CheY